MAAAPNMERLAEISDRVRAASARAEAAEAAMDAANVERGEALTALMSARVEFRKATQVEFGLIVEKAHD